MKKSLNESALLSIFKAEADERLRNMNKLLLDLEKKPDNAAAMKELQREIHNLKGSARLAGFNDIGDVSHKIEDVLSAIKNKTISMKNVTELLLTSLDAVQNLVSAAVKEQAADIDPKVVIQCLEQACGYSSTKPKKKSGEIESKQLGEILLEDKVINEEQLQKALSKQKERMLRELEETIRVSTRKLDALANTVGEMAINQAKYEGHLLAQHEITDLIRDQHRQFTSLSDKLRVLADSTHDTFTEDIVSSIDHFLEASNVLTEKAASIFVQQQDAASTMKMTTDKLQNQIMALRMLPISTVFDLFPRAVHDMAKMYNKKVNITITGSDTEVDKKMLEHIKDPLMHLLRNAIDHGIEPEPERKKQGKSAEGTIELSAWQEGDRVFIKVSDDGKGINPATTRKVAVQKGILSTEEAERLSDDEARHLIFQSGFSTSKIITDVSGRGVGVDVVRKNIEDNLGGQVILNSETNKGTVFTLILPLTLAVTPSVIIRLGHQMFAIPASSVLLGTRITASDIQSVEGKQAIRVIDSTVPLVRIAEVLRLPKQNGLGFYADTSLIKETDKFHAIVIEYGHQKLAFLVDELIKEQDIIVKPLEKPLQKLKNIAGVTILEKGEIVPIIHVPELIESAKKALPSRSFDPSIHEKEQKTQQKILIVEDSLTTRELEKSIMTSVGYFVETAVDGIDALNKIATSKPDLIITDIQMPRMDGFRMTEKLKQEAKYKDIPVVMVTALARDAEKKRGIELGADAYITKTDFDQSHLVDIIEQLIG